MSRKLRYAVAVLLLLGLFGFRYWRDHRGAAAPASPSPSARAAAKAGHAAPPAKPRMYGSIAFHPCTLAPQYGTLSVEAQCGTLSVPEDRARPDGRKLALAIGAAFIAISRRRTS
jgi:hypothetical protein